MHNQVIESCVETVEEALYCVKNGANRIEYCGSLDQDGLTPPFLEVRELMEQSNVSIRVMIRPSNTFYVSEKEIETMKESILEFSKLPIDGIVFGMLDSNNRINTKQIKSIIEVSKNTPITFHKAIDDSSNILEDVQLLNQFSQIDYILSSGGKATAWEGKDMLLQMKKVFNNKIIAAGSIRSTNLKKHHDYLGLSAYHGKKIVG